ncbi:hypothetical protein BKA56DRAFT_678113 [Ilyonectria sp. MPI-CAGE-AT-0026]|nr:hypothetical protein BKA56DRAFT_678113 [Ilyonectria sp. MPI-CAGE-AT-0026]
MPTTFRTATASLLALPRNEVPWNISQLSLSQRLHGAPYPGFNVSCDATIATSPPNREAKDQDSRSDTTISHHAPVFNRRPAEQKNEPFPFHDLDFQINLLLGLGHSVSPLQFATTSLSGRRPSQLTMILTQLATNTSTESLDSLREFQFKTVLVSTLLKVRVYTIVLELQEEIDWGDGCIA